MNRALFLVVFAICAPAVFAESKTYTWTDCPLSTFTRAQAARYFDQNGGTLRRDRAEDFLKATLHVEPTKSDYYVVHVVRWATEDDETKPQTIDKQNWYVFQNGEWSDQDFSERKRIYGAKSVRLLYVHLNRREGFDYSITYNLEVTKKTPAFLANLALIGKQFGVTGGAGIRKEEIGGYWGTHLFKFDYVPSDLKFTPVYDLLSRSCAPGADDKVSAGQAQPNARGAGPVAAGQPMPDPGAFAPDPGTPKPAGGAGIPALPTPTPKPKAPGAASPGSAPDGFEDPVEPEFAFAPTGRQVTGLKSETFDNEGRYFFDFSVGVPITKIRDVKFTSTSLDRLTATKTDQSNLFAFFNLYPVPVDTKRNAVQRWPHLVTGTKIGSQPLKKVVLAGGWGPVMANFYVGVLFNTRALAEGATCDNPTASAAAGAKLQNKTCKEFTFGINLPVGALISAAKK